MKKFYVSLLVLGSQYAFSQGFRKDSLKENSIDAIVLTGLSKKTFVKDNPLPIKRITAKMMEKTNETNIIDALVQNTPGLVAVKTGPNVSKPFIRGLGYNRVLTLYDGHRQEGQQWGDEHGIEVDSYNIAQAEVIKGPSSLMYGSDAIAGIISFFPYIPVTPNTESLKATSEYQTNNGMVGAGFRWAANKNNWIIATSTSLRFAKNYRNSVDGRVYNTGFNEKNFSLLLGYQKGNNYSHFNITYYDNEQGIPDGSRNPGTRQFTKQIHEAEEDIMEERPIVSNKELNSYSLSPLHQNIRHLRIYTNNHYETSIGDFYANVGYQRNNRIEYNHPTLTSQAGMFVRLNTLNYSFRYIPNNTGNFEFSFGANGMLQNNKNKDATDFPIPDYNLTDTGVFAFAKWSNNRWNVSGGVRYDHRNLRWDDFYVAADPATGFDRQVSAGTPDANHQFTAYQKKFNGISASLGASYKLASQLYIKANIGRAYRAPNITEMASNGLDPGAHIIYLGNKNFDPEFSFQQDLSLIASYRDFSGEINAFNNNMDNFIYLTMLLDKDGKPQTDAQGNRTYQYQQAKARLYGLEAYFALHPQALKGWTLSNSIALVYGFNKNPEFKDKGTNGEYLPLIAPLKWLGKLEKNFTLRKNNWKNITPMLEAEYNAAQNRYLGLNQTESYTASYFLMNIGISSEWKVGNKSSLMCNLQVNNVFDRAYQSHLSRLKYFEPQETVNTGHRGIYNMGRNFALKLVFSY
ncbi:TonB-dependent receptor [Elizabethkingia anophelis]|uniref:TonB-dependent receptor n=1 Tax=Elizabethkingia anophelis TaxID=1117645 RepID=UPI00200DEF97|nr:TonB-dependent receptor [Elizabethkingia anophelis]MCL1034732.1 TonB-dependent receptor [Elizabethkingia anophelis]MCW2464255.1 iron complex outermembrane receptor protein [Elizabethkingia anophelis]MCW2467938.1 iron complex outermembrane receptor protein [Elizabethkingia anophelis]MCW2471622.1 iron complex outermembrane receptor protein [Elizabethkingia anophelis]HBI9691227.1 TonB-dependent receptor [Elizabethkingia anophelis]